MTCRTIIPKHLRYDKRPTIGSNSERGESWDMYIIRKLKEEREYSARGAGMHNSSNTAGQCS